MKKLILLSIITFILFSFSFSQTTTSSITTSSILTEINLKSIKQNKDIKKIKFQDKESYIKCFSAEMKILTKEMQSKKRSVINEYKNIIKNATSSETKKEAKILYKNSLKDIQKSFIQSTKEIKEKCKLSISSNYSTTSISNSKETSTSTNILTSTETEISTSTENQ